MTVPSVGQKALSQEGHQWNSRSASCPTDMTSRKQEKKLDEGRVSFRNELFIPSELFENLGFFLLGFVWLGQKPSSLPIVFIIQFSQNTTVLFGGKLI